MRIHDIGIFTDKSFVPSFGKLGISEDIVLRIHSGSLNTPPKLIIFFSNLQEATNFKNAIIQSWETFLRKNKEKS